MKKIGREVLFMEWQKNNPRNGEGTFIRLKDGAILYAFTEYYSESWADDAVSRIAGMLSYDEGETWGKKFTLIEKDEGAQNNMSCSLLRLKNGDLGIIYLRKAPVAEGGCNCVPVFRSSSDEGKTWSDFVSCTEKMEYFCPINGSAAITAEGRILMPVSRYCVRYTKTGPVGCAPEGSYVLIFYSDDNGKTWQELPNKFLSPHADRVGLQEPSVYVHENGDLWLWMRTIYGFQHQSLSKDGGKTWTTPSPNFFFTSPDAPMQVAKTGPYTVAIFNPRAFYLGCPDRETWGSKKRTPFVCAVSEKDGMDFTEHTSYAKEAEMRALEKRVYSIEDDPNNSFCYPAIFDGGDYFLVAYYHSNNTPFCLTSSKIVKILHSEISQ